MVTLMNDQIMRRPASLPIAALAMWSWAPLAFTAAVTKV